ncbi:hypothetical protein [Pseudonocardia sp. NPDC049154]|uniref:hypothetical protein n=1 Tax=Pseudonocardia sp. NPDC049154 TaxID=3155501 RepID=UPI0033CD728D
MTHKNPLLGLVGPAGAGKDTVASLLTVEHGFARVAFADRLRAFVRAIDPAWAIAERCFGGYEPAKRNLPGFRERLIEVGQAARTQISPDIWVDALDSEVERLRAVQPVVVSDVRQRNEAEWILDCGGDLIAVTRPGTKPEDAVMAELMEGADFTLTNGGTPADLVDEVGELMDWLADS